MEKSQREFKAIVWTGDGSKPGERLTVLADSSEDAKRQLREKYGKEARISVWNEDDANRTR